MAAAPHTVREALALCGIDNVTIFNGQTRAERFAAEVFGDDFATGIDKSYDELQDDFKSYSSLTVAQGQIRLNPGVKRNLRAFLQWCKDQHRKGLNHASSPFPLANVALLLRQEQTQATFEKKSKSIIESAKPNRFTNDTKWDDWKPIFQNFLRSIPGRDGVPLSYIIRTNASPDPTPHMDFLDDYVAMAPLNGISFNADAKEVHTYIVKFISGNSNAEAKIQAHLDQCNGRIDFIALLEHYEGIGVHSVDILKADKILESLHYSGEKKPHMWWDQFEIDLNFAFNAYVKKEGRHVHSEEMKLRILLKKVKADFLTSCKSTIEVALSATPMVMTYEHALSTFRHAVNAKHPPEVGTPRTTRRVHQVDGRGRGRGRNSGGDRGRGRGGRAGRGRGNNKRKNFHPQMYPVRLTDGRYIDCHSSFYFDPSTWNLIPEQEKRKLLLDRARYKKHHADRTLASMESSVYYPPPSNYSIAGTFSRAGGTNMIPPPPPPSVIHVASSTPQYHMPPPPNGPVPPPPPPPVSDDVSRISQASSMMGGRNDQAQRSGRHFQGDRNSGIGMIKSSRRKIQSMGIQDYQQYPSSPPNTLGWNESDTNADTCCLGQNFRVLEYTERTADVSFHTDMLYIIA